jgi:tetratricopeptide (TPR) repeat protein
MNRDIKRMNERFYRYRLFLICICFVAAIFAVYWPVYNCEFIEYDDNVYVTSNANIQSGLNWKSICWAFTTDYSGTWHPVTWLSHTLDYQLFKGWAGGHHLINVLFHITNTLVLFCVLMRMTGAVWPSAFVAAIFALHPLHVESVAWIAERKDLLSTFFWLLTMWAYVGYVENPRPKWYLAAFVLFVLGLMSKPMLVTLPFVLLLLDFWPLQRKFSRWLLIEKIPFFICSFIDSVVTFLVQQGINVVADLKSFGLTTRISNTVVSYITYITKMIWPSRLAVLYPYAGSGLSITRVVVCGLLLVLISICFIYPARRHRFLAVGWLWYLGTLVPVIGLVQTCAQAAADRYTYMTLTGLFIIIAWSAKEFTPKWRYKNVILVSLAVVVLVAWALTASRQLRYWKNSLTLFEHTLKVTKNNFIIHTDYISCLYEAGRIDEVIEQSGKLLKYTPNSAETHNNLGVALLRTGRIQEAVEHFRLAIKYKSDFSTAHLNLACALQNQGNLDEAAAHLAETLRLDPNSALAHYYFGKALERKGKISEAVTHFEEALRLKPDWVEPMNDLAWFLAASKETSIHNPDKAVRLALRACELTDYKKPDLLDTLAVSYAATGAFDKAVETAEKALELCQSSQQETLKEKIKNRLVLFKAGKPYIENQ